MNGESKKQDNQGFTFLCGILVGLVFGLLFGTIQSEANWQNKIVDNPDYIAAVRSKVLAERMMKKSRGN